MKPETLKALIERCPAERVVDPKTGKAQDKWLTPPARLAFAKLVTPEIKTDKTTGKPISTKWSAALLFPADLPNDKLGAMTEAARAAMSAKWPGDKPKLRSPWRKQVENSGKYEGFARSGVYINVLSTFAPEIIDIRGNKLVMSDQLIYSGAWVRATVTCYAYDKDGNKGVSFGLHALQFLAHDEKFGGSDPASMFGSLEGVPGLDSEPMPAAAAVAHAGMNGAVKAPVAAPSADEFGL